MAAVSTAAVASLTGSRMDLDCFRMSSHACMVALVASLTGSRMDLDSIAAVSSASFVEIHPRSREACDSATARRRDPSSIP